MNDSTDHGQVVIVGAGPTGLMLACELGLAGVRATVLERAEEPRRDAPGMAINAGAVELLDQRGLMGPIRQGGMPLPAVPFSFLPLDPARLGPLHESTILVLQSTVEQVLRERARELGADLRGGLTVVDLVPGDADGAGTVVVAKTAAGAEERMTARYVVGCDGRDSVVRTLASVPFPGDDPPFHGLVGDVEVDAAILAPGQIGAFRTPTGAHYAGAPLAPGLLRVVTAEFDTEPPTEAAPTPDELQDAVLRLTGNPLKTEHVRWLARYTNANRNAETYRSGSVFLAGDAAHTYFPQNGLGISAGLDDAVNLGWKLAAVLTAGAGEELLDTYHAERHPLGAATGEIVRAQIELCHPPERVGALRALIQRLSAFDDVNRHLIETVTGTGVRYPMPGDPAEAEEPHPLLGRRLRNVPLDLVDGSQTSVAQLLHSGRGVLLELTGADSKLAADAAEWAPRIDVVAAQPSPHLDAAALLLRPDGHVAWVSTTGTTGTTDDDREHLRAALTAWWGSPTR